MAGVVFGHRLGPVETAWCQTRNLSRSKWEGGEHQPDELRRGHVLSLPARLVPAGSEGHPKDGKNMTRVGFEPTPGYPDEKPAFAGKLSLESHALDRSAILPCKYGGLVELCHVRWMSNGFSCGHLQNSNPSRSAERCGRFHPSHPHLLVIIPEITECPSRKESFECIATLNQ